MTDLRVTVVGGARSAKIADPLEAVGVEVTRVAAGVPDARRPATWRRFVGRFRGEADAVFVDQPGLVPLARRAAPGVPVLSRLRGDPRMDWKRDLAPRRALRPVDYTLQAWYATLGLLGARQADAIVPVSAWLAGRARQRGWRHVTSPVPVPWVRPPPCGTRLPEGRVVGTVTNLDYASKADAVADLVAALQPVLPGGTTPWVAGGGRFLGRARRRAGDRACMAGYVPGAASLIPGMDFFVYATYGEGYPSSVLEARAAGATIVANRHPVLEEQIVDGETGLLAGGPDDVSGMAEAVLQLLDDRRRARRLGEEARRRVFPAHSTESVGHALREVVEATLARADGGRGPMPS